MMRLLTLAALLCGCSSPSIFCAVELDGVELLRAEPGASAATCFVAQFPKFVDIRVEDGARKFAINADFERATPPNDWLTWIDGTIACEPVPALVEWAEHLPAFDLTVTADCGGTAISARFSGVI
jgi:hypothetical protein